MECKKVIIFHISSFNAWDTACGVELKGFAIADRQGLYLASGNLGYSYMDLLLPLGPRKSLNLFLFSVLPF